MEIASEFIATSNLLGELLLQVTKNCMELSWMRPSVLVGQAAGSSAVTGQGWQSSAWLGLAAKALHLGICNSHPSGFHFYFVHAFIKFKGMTLVTLPLQKQARFSYSEEGLKAQ